MAEIGMLTHCNHWRRSADGDVLGLKPYLRRRFRRGEIAGTAFPPNANPLLNPDADWTGL